VNSEQHGKVGVGVEELILNSFLKHPDKSSKLW
jgi:hypothetical protein